MTAQTESGLQVCYGKAPLTRGFSMRREASRLRRGGSRGHGLGARGGARAAPAAQPPSPPAAAPAHRAPPEEDGRQRGWPAPRAPERRPRRAGRARRQCSARRRSSSALASMAFSVSRGSMASSLDSPPPRHHRAFRPSGVGIPVPGPASGTGADSYGPSSTSCSHVPRSKKGSGGGEAPARPSKSNIGRGMRHLAGSVEPKRLASASKARSAAIR